MLFLNAVESICVPVSVFGKFRKFHALSPNLFGPGVAVVVLCTVMTVSFCFCLEIVVPRSSYTRRMRRQGKQLQRPVSQLTDPVISPRNVITSSSSVALPQSAPPMVPPFRRPTGGDEASYKDCECTLTFWGVVGLMTADSVPHSRRST